VNVPLEVDAFPVSDDVDTELVEVVGVVFSYPETSGDAVAVSDGEIDFVFFLDLWVRGF
jgi:hypothetical protein